MLKNLMMFLAVSLIFSGAYLADANATPSVRQLGINVSNGTDKPVAAVLPSLPKTNPDVVRAAKVQVSEKDKDEGARIPTKAFKNIGVLKMSQSGGTPGSSSGAGQASASGVSLASFNEVVGRVQALESESHNAITGVTESGSGNYVSGVSVGNDKKLNVEKTRVLYAPVRNAGSDTIVSDAEIWLIR